MVKTKGWRCAFSNTATVATVTPKKTICIFGQKPNKYCQATKMGNWHPLETMPYYTMDSISPFQMLLSSVIHCLKKIHHYLVIHFEYSLHLWQNKLYKIIKISMLIRWGSLKEATYFKCILLTFSLNLWCTTLCDWTELIVWETASRPAYSRPAIAKAITQSPRVAVISKRTPPPF